MGMGIAGEDFKGHRAVCAMKSKRRPLKRNGSSQTGKEKPGPKTIPDNFLLGNRNGWISLLEEYWPEIGWPLECIRNRRSSTIEDVQKAFLPLKEKPNSGMAARFYQDSTEVADAREMRKNRKQLSKLDKEIPQIKSKRDEQQWACRDAEAAVKEASPNDKDKVQAEAHSRKECLLQLEVNLNRAEEERNALYKKLHDEEGFIFRTELLDFLRSRRYAVSPRSLANALAGLPTMKWRQSFARCSAMIEESYVKLPYLVFLAISRMWDRRPKEFRRAPVDFFQGEAIKLPKKYGEARDQLCENWRDLRLAIEECWKAKHPAASIPFVITGIFIKNMRQQKGALERVLAAREKLVSP